MRFYRSHKLILKSAKKVLSPNYEFGNEPGEYFKFGAGSRKGCEINYIYPIKRRLRYILPSLIIIYFTAINFENVIQRVSKSTRE